ncbi:MAG TPA: hypothetical protein VKM72_03770 [Thermoanaerobaculia bacterium]|nr:hypothetical protein [Thermoanaerobaculia bacterium]
MSKGAKILLAIAATFAVLMVGSGVLLAASIARAGVVHVKIHEPGRSGTHVNVHIPAAVVTLGMNLMPLVLDDQVTAEIRADLGKARPAMAAALQELEDVPDAVLVDVQDGPERVRISKKGRALEIHVVNPEGIFEISLPAHLLGRIAREIA